MVKFDDVIIGKLTIRFNQPEQEVLIDIPLVGSTATLISKPTGPKSYEVRLEIADDKKFSFKISKRITDIGSNNKSTYYKLLKGNMEKAGINPLYGGKDFNTNFNDLYF